MEDFIAIKPLSTSATSTLPLTQQGVGSARLFVVDCVSALKAPREFFGKANPPSLSFPVYDNGSYTYLKIWNFEDATVAHEAIKTALCGCDKVYAALSISVTADTSRSTTFVNEFLIDVKALRSDDKAIRLATEKETRSVLQLVPLNIIVGAVRKRKDFQRWSNAYIPAILLPIGTADQNNNFKFGCVVDGAVNEEIPIYIDESAHHTKITDQLALGNRVSVLAVNATVGAFTTPGAKKDKDVDSYYVSVHSTQAGDAFACGGRDFQLLATRSIVYGNVDNLEQEIRSKAADARFWASVELPFHAPGAIQEVKEEEVQLSGKRTASSSDSNGHERSTKRQKKDHS